jgi:hypothetical protein
MPNMEIKLRFGHCFFIARFAAAYCEDIANRDASMLGAPIGSVIARGEASRSK